MRIDQQPTAADAYDHHRASGKASAQQGRIMAFIEIHGGDWSIGELAQRLALEKSTVSARLNELVADGSLVETRRRKDRVSGILVRAVGLPAKGQMGLFR